MDLKALSNHLALDGSSPSGLRWTKPTHKRIAAGSVVGNLNIHGYYRTQLLGNRIAVHRIVAVLVGLLDDTDDELEVDHIDGVRSNNSPENLRVVTHRQNHNNGPTHRAGRLCGARPSGPKWVSRIQVDGKRVHLGTYDTELGAHEAYLAYRKQHNLR